MACRVKRSVRDRKKRREERNSPERRVERAAKEVLLAQRKIDTKKRRQEAHRIASIRRRRANPEKWRAKHKAHKQSRRARLKGCTGRHRPSDIRRIYKDQRGLCAYHRHCGAELAGGQHIDHIVPLARGGSNNANNLQLCCPDCNIRKGALDPIDFAQTIGLLL